MSDYNRQILSIWDEINTQSSDLGTRAILEASMESLKFGYPVATDEELEEVVKLCVLYHTLHKEGIDSFMSQFQKPQILDISWSITERCGNMCYHCSTQASMRKEKRNVSWQNLERALREMQPYTNVLYISCEGDPFYYEGTSEEREKSLVDVIKTIVQLEFAHLSLQSLAPVARKFSMLQEIVKVLPDGRKNPPFFFPQISFNLYLPRAGLQKESCGDSNEESRKILRIPGLEADEVAGLICQLMQTDGNQNASSWPELAKQKGKAITKLCQYLQDVKRTITAYAGRGHPISFEIRYDDFNQITSLENLMLILDEIVGTILKENPEIQFPKCDHCSKIHYPKQIAHIVPLGRAVDIYPNGKEEEKTFFARHVQMHPSSYLCDNWLSWGSMTIDTPGFPQLCYSNLALTPQARTTKGPNLYSDGFTAIRNFYYKIWEERARFLLSHLPELVRHRPNNHYCPLALYKKTLAGFLQ